MRTRDSEDACEACVDNPAGVGTDETGAQEVDAEWVNAAGQSDGITMRICRKCLNAGIVDGPGFRLV